MCGVQRLPLWILGVVPEPELLVVGLAVVWLYVRIVLIPENDLLQIGYVDYADAGV